MDLRHDQYLLFSKFAHLYDAGVPLAEALSLVRRDLRPVLGDVIDKVVEDLYRGTGLADSLAAHPDLFSAEVVGVLRAGESRGELGSAARAVASGLEGRVLDPPAAPAKAIDDLLAQVGDGAGTIHLEPGRIRFREGGFLADGGEAATAGLVDGLARRAGDAGAFLWGDRLIRVVPAATPEGPTAVVRVSAPPGREPKGAAGWRNGAPRMLIAVGGDSDSALRSILRGFDAESTKLVAVNLPVPEAMCVDSVAKALSLDPDIVCVADVTRADEVVHGDVHMLVGTRSPRVADELAANKTGATKTPPLRIAVS